jgi:hypothetical protein
MSDLTERQPYKIIAEKGSYELLRFLDIHGKSSEDDLLSYLQEDGFFSSGVKRRLIELQNVGFVNKQHGKNKFLENYVLTAEGKEAICLIDVINGAPLSSAFEAVNRTSNFTLITHDMTNYFIDELSCQRDFSELYICSPWIRLMPNDMANLSHILDSARKINGVNPRIHVLTRPLAKSITESDPWNKQIQSSVSWLKEKGADIAYVCNLHTKLFIIFGRNFSKALFGSENLTGSKNIELGIRIVDSQIVEKLYIYWEDIYNNAISR